MEHATDNRSFLGLLLLSGYHCLANAKYHLTTEPDLTEGGAAELTRLHDDLSRHFLELRALGKDVGANLSGFHALLPMIKRKLSPDTLEARRSFVQDLTDEQIISGLARKMTAQKPERKSEKGERFMTATIQMDPVGNCAECCGIHPVESFPRLVNLSMPEQWHKLLIDQVSILCLPRRTPTVVRIADEPRGQHLREGSEPEDGTSDRVATELAPVDIHFSSTVRNLGVLLPVVRAMAYGENGKKRLVNCILDSASEKSLIRTDIADELELRGTPSVVTVRGVHGLSTNVADSRHMCFRLGPVHEEMAASMKFELTALCILSICDDLVASLTPWPREIDRMAGKRVLSDMYVDDLATSCDGVDETRQLVPRLTELMRTGGFSLKKWASNHLEALTDLPPEDVSSADEGRLWKTLDLHWNRHSHHLTLFHLLWLKGLDWDDQLPLGINSVWCQWKRELETLESVRVPWALMVTPRDQVRHYELHIFDDASEAAYGAVAYVMMESLDGAKEVRFCLAKTRVAPVKRLSLPRLELMAALLAARLKAQPGNPADKVSCGRALDTLRGNQLWWNCPAWLKEPAEQWPRLTIALSPEETRLASPERLTTISFLAALRPFIARRRSSVSFLRDLLHGKSAEKIREELAMRQIEWRYSTDRAPWCGGYWERLVSSMKNALRKVLGKELLRSWDLHTVLCELEARINDRPLSLLNDDPHDCAPWDRKQRKSVMVKVPSIVHNYNMHMGGVDLNNMLSGLYRVSHKSRNWTKAVFLGYCNGSDKRTAIEENRTAAGKGRTSVPGGRRRSAEPLQPRCDHRAVDGKRQGHKVSEGTDRPAEQIADPSPANIGPANKVHVREEELSNENDFYNWIARETEINANSFGALPILTKANYLLVVGNLSAKKLEKDKEKVESVVLAALSDSDEWIRALGDTLKHFLDASSGNFSDDGIPNLAAEFYRDIRDTIIKKTEETTAYLAPEENPTQNIRGYSYCLPLRSEINFVLKRRSKAAAQRASCLEKAAIAVRKQCHKTAVANLANSGTASASSSYFGNILAKSNSLLGRVPTKSLEDIKLKTASSRRDSGIKVLELEETPQHLKIERKEQERKRKEAEKLAKEEQKKLKAKERQEKQLNKAKLKQIKKEQTNIVCSIESDSTTQPKPNNPPGI
ncbi:hypothetical protein T03_17431, partial [Trichinella britovi]